MSILDAATGVGGRNLASLDDTFQLCEVSSGFAAQFCCAPGDLVGAEFTRLFGSEAEVMLLGQCLSLHAKGDGAFCEHLSVRRQRMRQLMRVVVRADGGVLVAAVHPWAQPHAGFTLSRPNARILERLAEGWTVEQIAAGIEMTTGSVQHRMATLLSLFDATSGPSAVSTAYLWGVLDPVVWPPRVAHGIVNRSWAGAPARAGPGSTAADLQQADRMRKTLLQFGIDGPGEGVDLDAARSMRSVESKAPAVTRAVALVEELARQRRPLGVAELARSLDLAKSTVANLCTALEDTHMIRRVDGRWALGYKVVELGQAFLAGTDLVGEFRRAANELPVGARETMLLAVLDGLDVVYLARHDGTQPVRLASDIGRRMPAVATALGKAMLAALPGDALEERLASVGELPVLTPRSHRTVDGLRRDLEATRQRGYAVDDEQNTEGVVCVSVALPGARTPTAVSATLLAARMTEDLRAGLVGDLTSLAAGLARSASL